MVTQMLTSTYRMVFPAKYNATLCDNFSEMFRDLMDASVELITDFGYAMRGCRIISRSLSCGLISRMKALGDRSKISVSELVRQMCFLDFCFSHGLEITTFPIERTVETRKTLSFRAFDAYRSHINADFEELFATYLPVLEQYYYFDTTLKCRSVSLFSEERNTLRATAKALRQSASETCRLMFFLEYLKKAATKNIVFGTPSPNAPPIPPPKKTEENEIQNFPPQPQEIALVVYTENETIFLYRASS